MIAEPRAAPVLAKASPVISSITNNDVIVFSIKLIII
jgi:hypothetical protein